MLPVVAMALSRPKKDSDPGIAILRVEIRECRNQFAHVSAYPDQSGCPPVSQGRCFNNGNVFLQFVSGTWRFITEGSGIDCRYDVTPAALGEACEALGLR